MRVGTLCTLQDDLKHFIELGFEFLEFQAPIEANQIPESFVFPEIPLIWQAPDNLPADHESISIRQTVLALWRNHLQMAAKFQARLMVIQFRRPYELSNKSQLIQNYLEILQPLTQESRQVGVQLTLRNSPDNRDQLQLLREIVRQVPGLAVGLDIAYAEHQVVKNLTKEYLWDSDLGLRLAHVYVSDTNGQNPELRLPLESLGIPNWSRLVSDLKVKYNASVTIDVGEASSDYLALSRQKWLNWWEKA